MLLGAGAFVIAATVASLVWAAVQAAIEPTLRASCPTFAGDWAC